MDRLQSKGNVICEAPQHTQETGFYAGMARLIPEGEWFYLSDDGEQTCCEKCWESEVCDGRP